MTHPKIQKLREIESRAVPEKWDENPAPPEWFENIDNNAHFCRVSRNNLKLLLDVIEMQREVLEDVDKKNVF